MVERHFELVAPERHAFFALERFEFQFTRAEENSGARAEIGYARRVGSPEAEMLLRKCVALVLGMALFAQVAGCGTILHPERKGQRDGNIDPAIAILDGLGLLLLIIPGVIAFAVDFSNGTIYLPHGKPAADIRRIKFDPHRATRAEVEALVERETGQRVRLDDPAAQVTELASLDEMMDRFADLSGARVAAVER